MASDVASAISGFEKLQTVQVLLFGNIQRDRHRGGGFKEEQARGLSGSRLSSRSRWKSNRKEIASQVSLNQPLQVSARVDGRMVAVTEAIFSQCPRQRRRMVEADLGCSPHHFAASDTRQKSWSHQSPNFVMKKLELFWSRDSS